MAEPWSAKGAKASIVGGDQFMILDSQDGDPATQNKRVNMSTVKAFAQSPWVVDVDANGFDLNMDSGTINFGTGNSINAASTDFIINSIDNFILNSADGTTRLLYKSVKETAGEFAAFDFIANNSTPAEVIYSKIISTINTTGPGAENGSMTLNAISVGTDTPILGINRNSQKEVFIFNNIRFNNLSSGNDPVLTSSSTEQTLDLTGNLRFNDRVLENKGVTQAAANPLILGQGNYFHITGTGPSLGTIQNIGWQDGAVITLEFEGTGLTIVNLAGGSNPNIQFDLADGLNFVTAAGNTITLVLDDTVWREIGRNLPFTNVALLDATQTFTEPQSFTTTTVFPSISVRPTSAPVGSSGSVTAALLQVPTSIGFVGGVAQTGQVDMAAFVGVTINSVTTSVIPIANTLEIAGVPIAGTNVTITDSFALNVSSGRSRFGGRLQESKGADVDSDAIPSLITLGDDGNFFDVIGTSTINYMTTTNWQPGSVVTLQFTTVLIITDDTGAIPSFTAPFKLSGATNFQTSIGDTLTFVLETGKQHWIEISRNSALSDTPWTIAHDASDQALTNLGSLSINDSANDNTFTISSSVNLAANRTLSLPLLTADDTFAFLRHAQTFTEQQSFSSLTDTSLIILATSTLAGSGSDFLSSLEISSNPISFVGAQTGDYTGSSFKSNTINSDTASVIPLADTLVIEGAPTVGSNMLIEQSNALHVLSGASRFGGRILENKGVNVTAANPLFLGQGNYFHITGSITLGTINNLNWQDGAVITLEFETSITVTNLAGGSSPNIHIQLADGINFVTAAGNTITLVLDDTVWREIGRNLPFTNVALLDATQTFTETQTFSAGLSSSGSTGPSIVTTNPTAIPGSAFLAALAIVTIPAPPIFVGAQTGDVDFVTFFAAGINSDVASVIPIANTLEIISAPTAGANVTINEANALRVSSGTSRFDGNILSNARLQESKGGDVASATTITLGAVTEGNYFVVTGTTMIDHMLFTGWQAGSVVTLQFTASLTVTNAAGSTTGDEADFALSGGVDFNTVLGNTLTVTFDGTNWVEISRTAFQQQQQSFSWLLSDETTMLSAGVQLVTEPSPYNMTIDEAIAGLTLAGTIGVQATGTVTCVSVLVNDTLTVNGLVYTAVTGAKADNTEFDRSGTDNATAADLADSITNDSRTGTDEPTVDQSASAVATNIVTITASLFGTIGNNVGLSSSSATLTVSGANLTGGVDLFTINILKESAPNSNSFASIFSTFLTIDNSEFTSTEAVTQSGLSTTTWEKGRRLRIDINSVDATARGSKATLVTHR